MVYERWWQLKIHIFILKVVDESMGYFIVDALKLRPEYSGHEKDVDTLICQHDMVSISTHHCLYMNVAGVLVI